MPKFATMLDDEYFMQEALKQAKMAAKEDEIPIGAIITAGNTILAKSYNLTEKLKDVTAHAEILAITSASNHLGNKYLQDCTIYVTIEPCPMCASALAWAQIGKVVYGAKDEKRGYSRFSPSLLHGKTEVREGVLGEDCANLMKDFFLQRR